VGSDVGLARELRIPFDQCFWRLQRTVGRVEGDIEEERLRRVPTRDDAGCLRADQVRAVALFMQGLAIALPIDASEPCMPVVVDLPEEMAVEVVEAAAIRRMTDMGMTQMPLPDDGRLVTRLSKRLGEQLFARGQSEIIPLPDHSENQTRSQGGSTREQRGAGRRADRLRVESIELDALSSEGIDVRRLDRSTVIADVVPPEIVREQDHDVGRTRRAGTRGPEQSQSDHDPCAPSHLAHLGLRRMPSYPCLPLPPCIIEAGRPG